MVSHYSYSCRCLLRENGITITPPLPHLGLVSKVDPVLVIQNQIKFPHPRHYLKQPRPTVATTRPPCPIGKVPAHGHHLSVREGRKSKVPERPSKACNGNGYCDDERNRSQKGKHTISFGRLHENTLLLYKGKEYHSTDAHGHENHRPVAIREAKRGRGHVDNKSRRGSVVLRICCWGFSFWIRRRVNIQ